MITVLTPATSKRLTTIEVARSRFDISEDTVDDAVVEAIIDAASQMVVDFCNRSFGRETIRQWESPEDYRFEILLARSPASVTLVTMTGEDLPPSSYHLDAERNILLRLHDGVPCYWVGPVEVTYEAGWILPGGDLDANLPATVEHATLLIAGAMWSNQQRDPLVKSETTEGIGRLDFYVPGAASRLPDPSAEAILRPYRRLSL